MNPETYRTDLGQEITAHRAYMGLSQRGMARRLDVERRNYQRIEQGRDACPPGFLDKVNVLVDQFDAAVDSILDYAAKQDDRTVNIEIQSAGCWEWERNVAYRAHVVSAWQDNPVTVVLTLVDDAEQEAS